MPPYHASEGLRSCDVCIVGAGPVGLKLALGLSGKGLKILLLEAGSQATSTPGEDAGCEIADPQRHHPVHEISRRGLGGTSAISAGRCIPLDDSDFAPHANAFGADWPIGAADVSSYLAEACDFLRCGKPAFQSSSSVLPPMAGLRTDQQERWSAQPNMYQAHREALDAAQDVEVLLNTVATRVITDPASNRVSTVLAVQDGRRVSISARAFILCGGALQTTRLLMATWQEAPMAFGGEQGPLGRYYMGHMSGSIAKIVFAAGGHDREFLFKIDGDKRYSRRFLRLDPAVQAEHGLLNMSARPELPPIHDPAHRSGALSLSYLGLSTPILGPKMLAEPARSRKLGPPGTPKFPHIVNTLRNPVGSFQFAAGFVKARYVDEGRMPGLFVVNPARRYAFNYHAEQAPSAASRVRVHSWPDPSGLPKIEVNLLFSEDDARSVVATHGQMEMRLQAAGVARLAYEVPETDRVQAVLGQAIDGAGQVGAARMSPTAATGVVDADCRVHGLGNLFVAGSAVLPRSGQANPMLTSVALAARLAHHVVASLSQMPEQARPAA